MRLSKRLSQTLTVKPAAAPTVYQPDDRLYLFNDAQAFTIEGVIQPLAAQADETVYGETPQAQRLLLYSGGETLALGMGVCVDVPGDAPCDFRIAGMPRSYPEHSEITLSYIPVELRA